MKCIFVFSLCVLFLSCADRAAQKTIESDIMTKEVKHLLDYDGIDYYQNASITKELYRTLYKNATRSVADSMKFGIYGLNIPNSISDTVFVSYLSEMGYKMSKIDPTLFPSIDSVFTDMFSEHAAYACIKRYKDILIFRKGGQIIATAKICFSCGESRVFGLSAKHYGNVILDLAQMDFILNRTKSNDHKGYSDQ